MLLIKRSFKKDTMRKKDDSKKQALFDATQQIIIHEGFSNLSMSKIAKAANVAPATLYTYFKNTDELINELFLTIHEEIVEFIHEPFPKSGSYKEWFFAIWKKAYLYDIKHPDNFAFCEQFKKSPRMEGMKKSKEFSKQARLFMNIIEQGVSQGIIRDLPCGALKAFVFGPIGDLAQMEINGAIQMTPELLDNFAELAWKIFSAEEK